MSTNISNLLQSTPQNRWTQIKGYFWGHPTRNQLLQELAKKLADPGANGVEQTYYRDLKGRIEALPRGVDPTNLCNTFALTAERYQQIANEVLDALKYTPYENLESLDEIYQNTQRKHAELESQPITETERAIYRGHIVRQFRELDNRLAAGGKPLHRYCGCHILEERPSEQANRLENPVAYPDILEQNRPLQGRSVMVYSWSLGAGHNVVQKGMSQRFAKMGMHSYHVQADLEILRNTLDILWKLTRGRYSSGDLIQYLIQHNWWKALRFIHWKFKGKSNAKTYQELEDQFVRSMLERGLPDLSMTAYARHTAIAANAAGILGIPHLHIESDLCAELCDIERKGDVKNPYFGYGIMMNRDEVLKTHGHALDEKQIYLTGLPVREAFLKKYDIEALRKKYGVESNARVVILHSGGNGIENAYAERIVQYVQQRVSQEKALQLPDIHLIILCGNNAGKKAQLEKAFAQIGSSPHMKVDVRGWTEERELAEFNAMAADPIRRGVLISAKGGGGTLSEGLASGVPMLIRTFSDMIGWEKKNIEYVCQNQAGLSFRNEKDLLEKLSRVFGMCYRRMAFDSVNASMRVVKGMLTECEKDRVCKQRQSEALSFRPLPLLKEFIERR